MLPALRTLLPLVAVATLPSCLWGTGVSPRFEGRPSEWLQIESDGQAWKLLAVEDEADHYSEVIALDELPRVGDAPLVGELPVDSVVTRKPLLWEFRVERRIDYRPAEAEEPDALGAAVRALRARLEACSSLRFESLYRGARDEMVEWQHGGCGDGEPEHEVVRFLLGERGLHRASLLARGRTIPVEMRTDWVRILTRARLTSP